MNPDQMERLDGLVESVEIPHQFDGLPVFAAGGCVRDAIRGAEWSDVDLVVAEVTPEEMEERGFKLIDNDENGTFAVFLDDLGREVAIAREERSTGDGHRDFEVTPVPADVPASQAVLRDSRRRDFTCNSMLLDLRWAVLHDPHNGTVDLEDGIIRHVEDSAFIEDPLRILRAARFAARLDAEIAGETFTLMEAMAPDLQELPMERCRLEMEKVLVQAEHPRQFFDILADCFALEEFLPELSALQTVPAGPEEFHSEGTAFEHTMLVLEEMKKLRSDDELALLMALFHDIGKASTSEEDLPSHPGHEKEGLDLIDRIADRLKFSNEQRRAAREASAEHMNFHNMEDLRDGTVLDMWERMRHMHRMFDLHRADSLGRIPSEDPEQGIHKKRLGLAKKAHAEWDGQRLIDAGHDPDEMGEDFGNLLHQKRVETMRELD